MAEWVDIPLAVTMGEDDSTYVSDLELLNLMLKENPPGSRKPYHIASVPTLDNDASGVPATGLIRGVCATSNGTHLIIVQGTSAYDGPVLINTFPGTAHCRMVDTGTYVVIVDGTNARFVDYSQNMSLCDIEGFIDVTYQDGYTIYLKADNSIYVSALDDPGTIGALDFTTADALGGTAVAIASINREVFVLKTTSIEHYYNAGGSGFPFQRSNPGVIEVGAQGTHTVQEHNGVLYFHGSDGRVYAMEGHRPRVISTPWIDKYLDENVSSETLFGHAYTLHGRTYYMLSGITEGSTETALVYDAATGLWHKRQSPIATTLQLNHTVMQGDQPYIAANNTATGNSSFYLLDPDGTNDEGASGQTTRTITLPQIDYGSRRVFMPELLLDMQKPATTGTITLKWSDDGGSTYSSGLTHTGGSARIRWHRLGSFYQRILRLTFSIASKISIMGIRARVEVGE